MSNRPALKVLGIYILGLLAGKYYDFPSPLLIFLALLATMAGFTLWYADKGHDLLRDVFVAGGLLLLGFVQYEMATVALPANHISRFANHPDPVAISGTIVKYPEPGKDRMRLVVEVEELFVQGRLFSTKGRILVNARVPEATYRYGDEVLVRGKLRKPRDRRNPGEFDYRAYLLVQDIYGIISVTNPSYIEILSSEHGNWFLRKVVYPVKTYLESYIRENLPQNTSALLNGLLIGQRGEISPKLRDSFAKVGVVHLLAVSGMHVGFIMLIFMGVFGLLRIPYVARVILTIIGLVFYAYLTNLKPPVVRASIMGGLLIGGTALGRKGDVYNTLAIAALVILIGNPLEIWQAGFQLSFAAVLSIVYLFPKLKAVVSGHPKIQRAQRLALVRYPLDLVIVSVAVCLGTLPFTLHYFERLPNFALFANLLCVPLAFCGLASGLIAAVLNLVLPGLAQLYLNACFFFLQALIEFVTWASGLPWAYWQIYNFSSTFGLLYLLGLILLFNLKRAFARKWLVVYALTLANIFLWREILTTDNALKIVYFDVGQGDAALLTFPNGQRALIDGGPRGLHSDAGKWVISPYLKRRRINEIDAVILSHADADHLGGLPHILRNFQVKEVWDNGLQKDSGLHREYLMLVDSLNITRKILKAGDFIADFSPVQIFVVHPSSGFLERKESSANDASLSLRVSYGSTDFLFIGDVEQSGETSLAAFGELLESEVLKVAHHGSSTSSTPALLEAASPEWAVISVGELNRFGHPDQSVVRRLMSKETRVLRTDVNGAIILTSNGITIEQVNWK